MLQLGLDGQMGFAVQLAVGENFTLRQQESSFLLQESRREEEFGNVKRKKHSFQEIALLFFNDFQHIGSI